MAKTIVGLFDSVTEAQSVVQDLVQAGCSRDKIGIMAQRGDDATDRPAGVDRDDTPGEGAAKGAGIGAVLGGIGGLVVGLAVLPIPGLGPVIAAGPIATTLAGMGIGAATGGIVGALVNTGVPEEHAHYYAEGVRRGGTLVTVEADDASAQQVADIMKRHRAVDVNQRAATWRQGGWTGFDNNARPFSREESERERAMFRNLDRDGKVAIPVVEEQFQVGKRAVEGGVRVESRVVERPVEQSVNLREERVKVERHPVDRAATTADAAAFREGTMEFKERSEEPVVSKTARVVEEVVVSKDARQRTETVRGTVRNTEVQVQQQQSRQSQPGERPAKTPPPTRR